MGRIFKKNKFKINDTAKKRPVLSCRTKCTYLLCVKNEFTYFLGPILYPPSRNRPFLVEISRKVCILFEKKKLMLF